MKRLKLVVMFMIYIALSCGSESQNFEQVNVRIQGECEFGSVNGLVLEFCLLDIEGTPRTTFNENENFLFSLTLKNQSLDMIVINEDLIDMEFYKVVGLTENKDYGRPFTSVWCEYSLAPRELKIRPGESFELNCPWILEEGIFPNSPLCKAESNEFLPVGEYSTGFDTEFTITKAGETIHLGRSQDIILQFTIK